MYILKNALKSITRSKGRNILIGIIIVIIAISSCVALSIKNSAAEIVKSYRENFVLTATIGLDRMALQNSSQTGGKDIREMMSTFTTPTIDDIKKYGTSDYLKGYTYTLSSSVNSSTLTPLSNEAVTPTLAAGTSSATSSKTSSNSQNNNNRQPNEGGPLGGGQFTRGDFTIVGYSGMAAMTNFVNGTYQITSGAMFEDANQTAVCVISEELATQNSVKIGDKVTLTNPKLETETYEFTIVGLYKDTTTTDDSSMNWFSNSANQIITNYTALANAVSLSKTASDKTIADATAAAATTTPAATTLNAQLVSSFILKDTDSVAAFTAELKKKGLSEYYTLTTNTSSFDESVKPLNNLDSFATIFLILVLLIGGIILSVLNMINIRERKYEVGVLRAIGMKKSKLAMQFVAELLMVTFVCILIGSAIGAVASVPTASMLLKSEVAAAETSTTQVAQNFGRPGEGGMNAGMPRGNGFPGGGRDIMGGAFNSNQKVNYVSQINAVISFKVLMQLFLIGILLTIISSIISVILISRYEPLKILSNRS